MRKSSGRISPILVVIFLLLGIGIIRAGIHDAIYFNEYEDLLLAVPVGLLFALPPLFIYYGDKKGENKSDRDRAISHDQSGLQAFFWFHVLVLIIMIVNRENTSGSVLIVYIYMAFALGYSGYALFRMKDDSSYSSQLKITNFKTHETITVDMYKENGDRKTTDEIKLEINGYDDADKVENNPISTKDAWNENYTWNSDSSWGNTSSSENSGNPIRDKKYENSTVLSYNATSSDEPIHDGKKSNSNVYSHDLTTSYGTTRGSKYSQNDMKNIVRKIEGITQIVSGGIWLVIILCMFYIPKSGVFRSDPIGLLFLAFGFIPIVCGIVELMKKK